MNEYDSIIKRLREWPHIGSEYKDSVDELHDQAADAIEELIVSVKELIKQTDKNDNWWAMAKSLMEMVTAIPAWVSVMDRLPENPGEYLVYLRSSEKMREDLFDAGLDTDGSYVTTAYYNDQQKIWQIDNDAYNTDLSVVNLEDDYSISYWMPLPNAPEVEK